MNRFWILLLAALVFSQMGCGKKQPSEAPAVPESAGVPAELPVLEQNKVASNPAVSGPQDFSFVPMEDEMQKDAGQPSESEEGVQGD